MYGGALREGMLGNHLCALPLPHYCSLVYPRQEFIHSSRTLNIVTAAHGTLPDYLILVASGAYACSPTELHTLAYFKGCYMRVWLLIQPKSRCGLTTPLWDTDKSWHNLNYCELLKIK